MQRWTVFVTSLSSRDCLSCRGEKENSQTGAKAAESGPLGYIRGEKERMQEIHQNVSSVCNESASELSRREKERESQTERVPVMKSIYVLSQLSVYLILQSGIVFQRRRR